MRGGGNMRTRSILILAGVLLCLLTAAAQKRDNTKNEWLYAAGDPGGAHYSALDNIRRTNVTRLKLAWTWKTGEQPIKDATPGSFEVTPLMINDVLYLSTSYNRVVALD